MDVCRKIAAVALLLMGSCAWAQNSDFTWDWRNQEVIGRNDPSIGNTSRLSEPERAELVDAIVLRLQKPMSDAGYDDGRIHEIATTTRVRFIDMGDVHPLLVTTSVGLEGGCDSLGNCPLWIFRRTSDGFVSLVDAIAASFTLQSADGAPLLVLMRHVSQKESALMAYRFADGKLTPTACYKALWPAKSADSIESSDPKLEACEEQPKWEKAPAELNSPASGEPKAEPAAPPESKPETAAPAESSQTKPKQQQANPDQPAPSEQQAAPNPDQTQTQQPAPEAKPDQQQANPDQPAPSDKQAAPNPDQTQTQQPAPEAKPNQQQATPDQPAPSDKQAAPNPDQTQTQQPAPEAKPGSAAASSGSTCAEQSASRSESGSDADATTGARGEARAAAGDSGSTCAERSASRFESGSDADATTGARLQARRGTQAGRFAGEPAADVIPALHK